MTSTSGDPFPTGRRLSRQLAELVAGRPILDRYPAGSLIDRPAAIALYRAHLEVQIACGKLTAADFLAMRGSILGCFCKPQDCHGDVIAEFCEWFARHPDATAGPPDRNTPRSGRLL